MDSRVAGVVSTVALLAYLIIPGVCVANESCRLSNFHSAYAGKEFALGNELVRILGIKSKGGVVVGFGDMATIVSYKRQCYLSLGVYTDEGDRLHLLTIVLMDKNGKFKYQATDGGDYIELGGN